MLHSHRGWIRDCSFLRGRGGALVGFGWGSREKNGFRAGSSKENEGKGGVTWKRLMKWLDVLLFKKYPFANKYRQYINLLENFLLLLIKFPRLLKHYYGQSSSASPRSSSCSSTSSSRSSSSPVLLWKSLSGFSPIAYSSGCRKRYTLSLPSGLRFVIILLPAALMTWFPCKRCAMYGASRPKSNAAISSTLMQALGMTRQEGYWRHCGRSLPSGFPTKKLAKFWSLLQGTPLWAGRTWQIVLTNCSLCHSTCPIRLYVLW